MIDPNMSPVEILRMALEREKETFQFYSEAAKVSTDPASKVTFQAMADEEKRHIQQLEEELDRWYQSDN